MNKFYFNLFVIFVLHISSLRAEYSEDNNSEHIEPLFADQWDAGIASVNTVFKYKCDEALGEKKGKKAAKEIKEGAEVFKNCLSGLLNFSAIPEESEKDKIFQEIHWDVMFKELCGKRNVALDCLKTFSDQLKQCLSEPDLQQQSDVLAIFHSVVDFACQNNGDQGALFFAKNGPECLKSKEDNIKQCYADIFLPDISEKTENSVVPQNTSTLSRCDKLRNCVVTHLKSCDDITPSNLIDSLMRFVEKDVPCDEV